MVADGRRGDAGLAHRVADLVEAFHHVAGGEEAPAEAPAEEAQEAAAEESAGEEKAEG